MLLVPMLTQVEMEEITIPTTKGSVSEGLRRIHTGCRRRYTALHNQFQQETGYPEGPNLRCLHPPLQGLHGKRRRQIQQVGDQVVVGDINLSTMDGKVVDNNDTNDTHNEIGH